MPQQKNKTNIKDVISVLCNLLRKGNVCDKITPEDFRKAKHKKEEAKNAFLILIKDTLCFCCLNKYDVNEISLDEILQHLHYPRSKKFRQQCSSEEFLLLFGWLFLKLNVFQRLERVAVVDDPIIILVRDLFGDVQLPREKCRFQHLNMAGKSKYFCLLNSRLKFQEQQLLNITNFILMAKCNIDQICTKNICKNDVILHRYQNTLCTAQTNLEKKVVLLKLLLEWRATESVFWAWLNSIGHSCNKFDQMDGNLKSTLPANATDYLKSIEDKFGELKSLIEKEKDVDVSYHYLTPEVKNEIVREIGTIKRSLISIQPPELYQCFKNTNDQFLNRINCTYTLDVDVKRYQKCNNECSAQIKQSESTFFNELLMLCQKNEKIILIPHNNIN